MKKVCAIAFLVAAVVAVTAVSGCTDIFGPQSTPVPTVYGPVPSPLPTTTPTPAPIAGITHSIPSSDIAIIAAPMDYKVVTGGRTRDGMQYENIYLLVENTGTGMARNVALSVVIINENNMNLLVSQQFKVGDLARGERKTMNMSTETHEYSNFIKMTVEARWGANNEYYSSVPLEDTYSNLVL